MNSIKKTSLILAMVMTSMSNLFAQTMEDGVKKFKYKRFESAKAIFSTMTDPLSNYYLGLIEIENENLKAAEAIFQKFMDDPANQAGLARVKLLQKDVAGATSFIEKAAAKAKKKDIRPLQYAADAITYTEGMDPNKAIELYKKALETEKNGDLYIGLGDAYRKLQGGGGNAMTNYENAEMYPNVQSLANYKKGNLWYAAKNYDSALANYARASELDKENPLPFKALADAYYKVNRFKLSKENIEKYLELSDKSIDDQIQYANTLYLAKEYQNAIQKMNDLIGKGAERPYMYRVIGFSQYETKDYTNAKMNMDKFFAKQDALKIIPLDHIYYGKILLKDTNTASMAEGSFNKGIAIDTSSDKTPVFRNIAESYYDAEMYGNSGNWYKKIVESNSPGIEAVDYWWAGVMYFYARDYANAEPMIRLYNSKYPDEPTSIFWMARITEATKDKDYKTGAAKDYYNQWIGKINEDPTKKKDLLKAYTYLAMVAYTANNKEEAKLYSDKLIALDPANSVGTQIQKAIPAMK
jgi:tetratricopeptide (TPR) repeat protein